MSKDETGRAVDEPQPPTTPLVSIIIPARNEENNFARLERELLPVVDPLPYRFEFIVIDNASTDRTGDLAKALCKRDQRWCVLEHATDRIQPHVTHPCVFTPCHQRPVRFP